jgi:hypothetical protein
MSDRNTCLSKKPVARPSVADRLALRLSASRSVDGLWVGTLGGKAEQVLSRVEDALHLIKGHDPLYFARVLKNLERVWVRLLPNAGACYQRSVNACVLDERYVLSETTSLEQIAAAIIHEATHARLERWGIDYDEKLRPRIEAICLRRELAFATRLPHGAQLREQLVQTLTWYSARPGYFSDASFARRDMRGHVKAARHVGIPDRVIRALLAGRAVVLAVRGMISRIRR